MMTKRFVGEESVVEITIDNEFIEVEAMANGFDSKFYTKDIEKVYAIFDALESEPLEYSYNANYFTRDYDEDVDDPEEYEEEEYYLEARFDTERIKRVFGIECSSNYYQDTYIPDILKALKQLVGRNKLQKELKKLVELRG